MTMRELWPSSWALPALESQSVLQKSYKDCVVSKHKLCDNKLLHILPRENSKRFVTNCNTKFMENSFVGFPWALWQHFNTNLMWSLQEICNNWHKASGGPTSIVSIKTTNCCKCDGWYSHVDSFETNGNWTRGFSRVSGYRFVSNELKVTYH